MMRKLIIQIPCYNEEETLGTTLSELPREVTGFDSVEWLVVDDGSDDKTVEIAQKHGADHIISLPHNQGLSAAFVAGLEASLKAGADVIVNTDGDNQYDAASIPDLVAPIVNGEAQIVVGERPIMQIQEFSFIKKLLQRLGSAVVRVASGTSIPDATSGFRAIHRDAAFRLCVFNTYTYTLETIIQAGRKNIPITSVRIRSNPPTRESRLIKSVPSYVRRSLGTIVRIFVLYRPLRSFSLIATVFLVPGILIGLRFVFFKYLAGQGGGNVQSLILASILIVTAMIVYGAGILADLVAANRVLLEEIRMRILRSEVDSAMREAKND